MRRCRARPLQTAPSRGVGTAGGTVPGLALRGGSTADFWVDTVIFG